MNVSTKLAARARWHRRNGRTSEADTIEAVLAAGGLCRRCGRQLTDPVSVARGVGPECVRHERGTAP